MGISGLLPFLKKASRPANVREFSGKTAAVDVYCWLHKGAFGCADKLVQNIPTDGYVLYVMKFLDMLLYFDIKPILVFDGRNLPSKSETEKKRRENREKYRKMAKDYLREGKYREARECFQRCVDITPAMARDVIEACRQRNIDCIVAPYEADAQLVFLSRTGIADVVISEDSDLAPFGCNKILFKMDISGNGTLIEREKIPLCLNQRADNFTFEKFRYMCIMAGCDYHPSLPGIGIGKSCKFWGKVTNPDVRSVLLKIPSYLNMPQLEVTEEYIRGFIQANETFLYQLVYDPKSRELRPLMDYPDGITKDIKPYPFAGEYLDADLAFQMAIGNIDLHTLQLVSSFHPDVEDEVDSSSIKPRYGFRAKHRSIWWTEARVKRHEARDKQAQEKNREKSIEFLKTFSLPTPEPNSKSVKRKMESFSQTSESMPANKAEEVDSSDVELENETVMEMYSSSSKRLKTEDLTPAPSRIVYVSKYFSGKKDAKPMLANGNSSVTVKNKKRQSGDWFNDLDNASEDSDSKVDEAKENFQPTVVSKLPPLKNSQGSRQAFRPVVTASADNQTSPEASLDLAKKRNPFARKSVETGSVEDLSQPISECSVYSQSPLEISSSQLSVSSIHDSQCENLNSSSVEKSDLDESESVYFTKKSSPSGSQSSASSRSRVPVSGLLKRSASKKLITDAKQPKLFDLWKKK